MELKAVTRDQARVYQLSGRDWLQSVGVETTGAGNLTVGYSVFAPGSAPEGSVHQSQEDVVYIVAGKGELVTPTGTVAREPGTCVYIPAGLHHQSVSHRPDELEMVTSFSPRSLPVRMNRSRAVS